jgi:eukaryotic-like serine/threonine-protein kinase
VGSEQQPPAVRTVGRYALYGKIAAGGMATVHLGRLLGPVGFSRTVAIKRLHPQFTEDPDFVSMFLDEARLAARIRHPSVVPTLDVVTAGGEIFLVMEFVQGETLARILRTLAPKGERIPLPIVASVFSNVLHGLHAAHEAKSERGTPLEMVHRDVSPHNVMIGVDGTARLLDFGIAKAVGRLQTTREGQIKGKLAYLAPELLGGAAATRQTDVYATAVCLWEALTGKRLFEAANEGSLVNQVLKGEVKRPGELVPELPPAVDPIVMRGLDREPANRFATAREMATALEDALPLANPSAVGAWVEQAAAEALARKAAQLAEIERTSSEANIPADDADATVPAPPPREAVHIDSEPPTREPMYSVSLPTMGGMKNPAADAVPEAPAPQAPLPATRPRRAVLLVGGGVAVVALVAVLVTALRSPETETRPAAEVTTTTTMPAPSLPEPPYVPVALPPPVTAEATSAPEAGASPAATSPSNAAPPSTAPRPRPASHAPAPAPAPAPSPTKHAPPAPTHGAIVFTNPG